jgi:hypothetical protein
LPLREFKKDDDKTLTLHKEFKKGGDKIVSLTRNLKRMIIKLSASQGI